MTEKRTIGKLIEKEVRKQQLSIVEFADSTYTANFLTGIYTDIGFFPCFGLF